MLSMPMSRHHPPVAIMVFVCPNGNLWEWYTVTNPDSDMTDKSKMNAQCDDEAKREAVFLQHGEASQVEIRVRFFTFISRFISGRVLYSVARGSGYLRFLSEISLLYVWWCYFSQWHWCVANPKQHGRDWWILTIIIELSSNLITPSGKPVTHIPPKDQELLGKKISEFRCS